MSQNELLLRMKRCCEGVRLEITFCRVTQSIGYTLMPLHQTLYVQYDSAAASRRRWQDGNVDCMQCMHPSQRKASTR